jgi:hypothetical protein
LNQTEADPPPIQCAECRRPWLDPREFWQTFLTIDDEVAHYCPVCAGREFGGR